MVKWTSSIKSNIEELKSILVWDQFYRVALDIAGPLPKTNNGNRYTLVAIDTTPNW
jgi:hypothetical protein